MFCLRHGESENVLTGTAGVVLDAPLTPRGRAQAAMAGQMLASESISKIYSSTAIRASSTAAIIAHILGVDIIQLPELLEVNIGVAEGATDSATRARTATVLRDWIVKRDLSARVADGETGYQVVARICSALTAIAGNHHDETVVVVGHVASLTVALNELCKLDGTVWGTPLPHGIPFPVKRDGNGWKCVSWTAG
jgi:broad specificity phosphatase PhoE